RSLRVRSRHRQARGCRVGARLQAAAARHGAHTVRAQERASPRRLRRAGGRHLPRLSRRARQPVMIAELSGTLLQKGIDRVVVDVGGAGYSVLVSLQTLADLGQPGEPVRLHTYLQVRQDALVLFGFATNEERLAFELLIGVQQIGPKVALSILSALDAGELG